MRELHERYTVFRPEVLSFGMFERRWSLRSLVISAAVSLGCATGNDVNGIAGGGNPEGGSSGGPSSTGNLGGAGANGTGGAAGGQGGSNGDGGQGGMAGAGGSTASGTTIPGTLIISEYVEGTGNNKAIEIANVGDTDVSTADCLINRYQNGAATAAASPIILDTTMLGPNQVVVVCNSAFTQTGLCDQLSANLQHSGNDVVELQCGGIAKDIIGRIGEDTVWGTAPATTEDATLRRNCEIIQGDLTGGDAFDPSVQWMGFTVDTVSDLGQRNCP